MGMNGNQMGREIAALIINSNAPSDVRAECIKLWEQIGTAIVTHIQNNAVVPGGIPVSKTGGAGSTSGPGQVQ